MRTAGATHGGRTHRVSITPRLVRPTDHRPIKAMQLLRFDGKTWLLFGDIIGPSS
jgi:hypothetical protein